MALQKSQLPIAFAGGIDTKTDPKQVVPGKLLELENGVFTKKGLLKKRFGYDILSRYPVGSLTQLTSATGIARFKNELNMFDGKKIYTYIEALSMWNERGTASSVTIANKSIIRNPNQQTNPDFATNQGISVYVWDDDSGGVRYSCIDESSGSYVTSDTLLSITGLNPRVVAAGNYIFIYYIEGVAMKFRYIQVTDPATLSAAVDLTTSIDPTDKIFDAQQIGDRAYIVYNNNNVLGGISLFYMTANKTVSSEYNFTSTDCSGGVAITSDSNDNIWVAWSNGTVVSYLIRDYTTDVAVLAPTTVEAVANVRNVAITETDIDECTILYEVDASPAKNFIRKRTATLTGSLGTASVFLRTVGLASKFFSYNDENYITVVFGSDVQPTYFVYSLGGDIITKISQNNAGGYTTTSQLPSVYSTDTGIYQFANTKKSALLTENGALYTALGINSTEIDFASLNNFVTAELGNNLHIVGGTVQSYDGIVVNETGFAVFPENITATEVNVGTGNLLAGTYQWIVTYAWTDNQGQLHRSADSIAVQAVIGAGPSNIQLTIPTLHITKKENVIIEVYRTDEITGGGGDIFYKVTDNSTPLLNDTTVDSVTFVDNVDAADLVFGELLYTTGGVLSNIAPPPSSVITNFKNRLVVKSSDEENVLWFSKIREEGKPVEFSDFLRITVDSKGGDISALGTLDDKLVIFKEDRLYMQAGDGPNNLGEQSDFGLPQLITADAGCVDVNSVVETPVGLMFKSKKGIYLLNRGLYADYIGAEVEAYNDSRVTSAVLVPDANQVRFTTEDNLCLVYDYYFKQWSTFTNHQAVGATIYQDKFTFIKADARVYVQNDSKYTDGAEAIKLKIVTSWMQLGDMSGFQRLYKFLLLGQYKSKHRLRIKVGYDFNSTFIQEVILDPYTVLGPIAYGDSSPYGEEDYYGGKYPLYQWRIFPKKQKCTSFRVCIEDIQDDVFGESFNISSLRMEIGSKVGSNKLGTDKSYGTE